MDCLEFRRRLAADPGARDPEFLAHRDGCRAGCSESWRRAQHFERRLVHALRSIDVPPGLAERVLLAQATSLRSRARHRWRASLALAASLLVALIVAGYARTLQTSANGGTLAAMAVAHMHNEETFALALTRPLARSQVQPAFAKRGLALRGMPTHAVYATDCVVGPYNGVHLVLRENGHPVTALYIVDHRIGAKQTFFRDGWHGREVPMGNGTLVLLGHATVGFAAAESAVADAVLGPAQDALGDL